MDIEYIEGVFMNRILKIALDFILLIVAYFRFCYKPWRANGRKTLVVNTLMYVYLSLVLFVTLMPVVASLPGIFNHPYKPMQMIPFDDLIHKRGDALRQILLNTVMTIPFGFLLPLVKKQSIFTCILWTFLFSLAIELLQPLLNGLRSADVTDLITNTKLSEKDLKYGNLSVVTTAPKVTYKTHWMHKDWWDGIHDMWDDFTEDGRLEDNPVVYEENNRLAKIGSMAVSDTLEGGESKDFLFLLTWYFPNRMEGWSQECCGPRCECKITQNYYANLFKSSWHVAEYMIENFDRLYKATSDFHKALFESSLPPFVVDAIASNMTVLRSTTCFRLKNGKFFGYEGCFDQSGCCEGNCTHVWNYAQTLAFLYPDLEKDMRRTEFNVETEEDGKMAFRTMKLFGSAHRYHPAADGQLGCIIRLYRDWKFSGDRKLLESVWDNAKKALDFAFTYWDKDGDFVLDSQQHNTYDIEFYGPNSLTNSMFYGALKAGAKMAEAMGDFESKQKFEKALQEGSKKMDALLWNGEYYIQVIDDVNRYKYQYGKGCLSDQLLGQLNSHIVGLGYILPEEHVKKAVHSIYKYNFFKDLSDHHNVQRTYALNDEQGLVLCTWPKGGRPKFPFVYCDEVWTGFEYQVAAHLIFEGFINEGLEIVKAVRDRHDGFKRNPWNEVECGHHYVRSMSSWGLLIALCGYKFDLVEGVIEFNPVINKEDFRCFFSCGKAWGIFEQKRNPQTGKPEYNVKTLYGNLEGITVKAGGEVIEI
jgi:non-lysosomal glucosylceramidase